MNEALILISAFIDLGVVLIACLLGREWLYATIVVNLLLIGLFGAKLVAVFGYATNIGNVFYAAVFFAMYLLLENGTRRDAIRGIWLGGGAVALFFILVQTALVLESIGETLEISRYMEQVLTIAPRIAFASICAFVIAQYANIALYTSWHEPDGRLHWWLRLVAVILFAQLIDSVIFFTIAFAGSLPREVVIESMFTGYLLKAAVGVASISFIYLSRRIAIGWRDKVYEHSIV